MDTLSDRELIVQLCQGSLEALGLLYDRHQRMVYRTALAITGDPDAAADLLQDVFLRLHRLCAADRPGTSLGALAVPGDDEPGVYLGEAPQPLDEVPGGHCGMADERTEKPALEPGRA